MLTFKAARWLSVFLFCWSAFSCNDVASNFSDKNKKIQFLLKPQIGLKYYYTVTKETSMVLEVNDNKIKTSNSSEIGLVYQVVSASDSSIKLELTYDKIHIITRNKDNENEIRATKTSSSFNPIEKSIKNLIGSSIFIDVSKKGDIINIVGSREIADKLLGTLYEQDQNTTQLGNEQLSKLVGETSAKGILGQNFKVFPDSALSIGDTWNRKTTQTSDLTFEANTTYTLTSVSDRDSKIAAASTISSNENDASIMGYKVTTNLRGTQNGEFNVDIKTGMLQHELSNSKVGGTISILGREVPVEIKIKKEVLVVKM